MGTAFECRAGVTELIGDSVSAQSSRGIVLDGKCGYIYSCPTDIRASVRMVLPRNTKEGLKALQGSAEEV